VSLRLNQTMSSADAKWSCVFKNINESAGLEGEIDIVETPHTLHRSQVSTLLK
jgi:hypothetical protein